MKEWIDQSLKWDPTEYGHIYELVVEGTNIWRPEITLANGMNDVADLSLKDNSR